MTSSPPDGVVVVESNAESPQRERDDRRRRPDDGSRVRRDGAKKSTAAICRRSSNDDPEYISWRDEGCRLLQVSPRHRVAPPDDGGKGCSSRVTINTYYQDLVRQKLDQQQIEYERQQMKIINNNRPCLFRSGGKGAPWRQLKLTIGASGENVMFVDGDMKSHDMAKFYPGDSDSGTTDGRPTVRGPPRPLPHFFVGGVPLDPNRTTARLQERSKDSKRPPGVAKSPRSHRENRQPNVNAAECPN